MGAKIMTEQNTTMTYDSQSKKRAMDDPDMGSWDYLYDKSGNLEFQKDGKGQVIEFKYDGLNRLSRKNYWNPCGTYPPPGDPPQCTIHHSVVFVYDDSDVPNSKGMLTKIYIDPPGAEPKEDYILEYDVMQRPKITRKIIGAEEVIVQKTYDSAGRVVSITYPGNHVYSYEYDVGGNLKNLKDNTGLNVVEYSDFTALGQPGLATFSNGVVTDYDYYPETGRLTTLQTNGPGYEFYQNFGYWYDGKGNITIIQDKYDNGSTKILHSYGYDALDRLGTAAGSGADVYSRIYLYDRIGNITSKSDVGTYRYDPYGTRPHAVKSILANGPIYEQVPEINIVYDYDQKPTLIQKKNAQGQWEDVEFTYDGNSQRVKKVSPDQTALYFGDLYEKRIGEDTFKILHLFAGSRRVASIWLDNVNGSVLFQQFYHPDHLGSTNIVTDQNGNKKERNEFFPFGTYRVEEEDDPNFPNVFYTYTGQEEDDELEFYNYKARLYDPVLGRFISPDPIDSDTEDPQTLNRYAYVRNNPTNRIDPTGFLDYLNTGSPQDPVWDYDSSWKWVITPGDTFTSIASETGFRFADIAAINPQITNPNKIYAGDTINIPQTDKIEAFQWSMQQEGSTAYGINAVLDKTFGQGDYKCNAFPRDAYQKGAGISDYPLRRTIGTFLTGQKNAPISAKQLGDANSYGPFIVVIDPLPGDIVSNGVHSGIVGLRGNYISASSVTNTVVIKNIGSSLGPNVTYKRYNK
jgi:RHS repeat-associated protein